MGFAYLMQVEIDKAKAAFEKAISLDQAAPLPRLGLGLAIIREGNLEKGGREIEIAASLDPNNSLIRSYLGKTYYEEKRTKLDEREYAVAKELDPNDPTPWFYDAIAKQTTNRPVEALHNMQKAIELNDNRAVYRSKLQLDSDLASRESSLARIYNNLGFQQRGLVEGWESVNTDPTNYSAHRFLSDSYSALPRHEIARVSELLQSQLLQPINITPIQPASVESNLFLISSQGPSSAGFNTYNPLFNRNQATLQAGGLAGSNDTWAGEGIVSGIYKGFSLSAGYNQFETDGFRIGNEQTEKLADIFAQWEITYKTSIQAEYRYRDSERGDSRLRFFEDDYLNTLRTDEERDYYRFGLRHSFTPSSILLANFSYQDADSDTTVGQENLGFPVTSFDRKIPTDAFSAEAQYLFRSRVVNFVSGAGYFDIDQEDNTTIGTVFPPPFDVIQDSADLSKNHANIYIYSYINPWKNLTFTVGASGDFLDYEDDDAEDKDEFNPKLGVSWNPFPVTTLRAAAFKVLKRTLIVDQTLEPTQVAGFNQFYDDPDGTESTLYGGAIDQKFTQNIFGGLEFTYRDLKIPYTDASDPENFVQREEDAKEYLGRAYLFWTPHNWFSMTAEYLYEKQKSDGETDLPVEVDTYRIPLGINFFHPSGIGASVKGTYYNQDGDFVRLDGSVESGNDSFWLLDAAISYRLPKRYGFITVGGTNLTNEEFNYYDTDFENPLIQPDRTVYATVTLAFP